MLQAGRINSSFKPLLTTLRVFAFYVIGFLLSSSTALAISDELSEQKGQLAASTTVVSGYSVEDFVRDLELKKSIELYTREGISFKQASVGTGLGNISIRWPASETAFAPEQPVIASADAVASTLQYLMFPSDVLAAPYGWNIIIQPGVPPEAKARFLQSADCHTAFMGPPADIVVNYDKLLSPCDLSEVGVGPDAILSRVLIHEIAHGVEFRLLGKGFSRRARWHSEGFALWIESLAVESLPNKADRLELGQLDTGHLHMSKLDPSKLARDKFRDHARNSLSSNWRPWLFKGSSADYANSYAMIAVVAEKRGISRLIDIYREMDRNGLLFQEAGTKVLGWDIKQWINEAQQFMKE